MIFHNMVNVGFMGFILSCSSCNIYSSEEGSSKRPINPSMSFFLSEKQIIENDRLALQGDSNAAFKNHQYYSFLVQGSPLTGRWLFVAVMLEHPVAINNWNVFRNEGILRKENYIFPPENLEKQKELSAKSHNLSEYYWLYLHCLASEQPQKAEEYKTILQQQGVAEKLLSESVTKRLQELK